MKVLQAVLVTALVLVSAAPIARAAENRFWLAAQHDFGAKRGFYFNFENSSEGSAPCRVATLRLILGVGDGRDWRFLVTNPDWQYDRDYTAKAVIGPDSAELWLDGRRVEQAAGGFTPFAGPLLVNHMPGWANGPAEYLVRQASVAITAEGMEPLSLSFEKEMARPLPLVLFEPQAARSLDRQIPAGKLVTITAVFRLVRYPNLRDLAPFIDRYGQSRHADWPGKIRSDADLSLAAKEEARRLQAMPAPKDYDRYGGWTKAGWREKAAGFYRTVRRQGVWWLVSPEGNPCFYTGLCSVPALSWETTPVSGREWLYEWLPPKDGPFAAAWSRNQWGVQDGTEYFCFHTANLIRKYGAGWDRKAAQSAVQRMKAWVFSGGGKWGAPEGVPSTPVLYRWDVPNLARHPDIFDPKARDAFRESLRKQIEPRRNDPLVVGWSLGNEYDEIVTKAEIQDILKKPANVPGKRALIDYALKNLYEGDSTKLLGKWEKQPQSWPTLYDFTFDPPDADLERLRRFYADRYYAFVYRAVKELDPNHLYFGFWIVPNWWENEEDWRLGAKWCDIIGYDRYALDFDDPMLLRLMKESDKPILCGEYSFPSWYDGARGFGLYGTWAADDARAGGLYARWVEKAARNPWCVGVMWFQYRDQPLTGRGPGRGSALVYGEHYSFGMVDGADRPKWDLVERVRKANMAAVKMR